MLSPADLLRIAMLRPELKALALPFIHDVESATGKSVSIPPRGGMRSYQDQVDLYNARASNPFPVAVPGTSRHEYGAAIDINIAGGTNADYATAADIGELKYFLTPGLYFNPPDRVHFQLRESLNDSMAAYELMQTQRQNYWIIGGALVAVGFLLFTSNRED